MTVATFIAGLALILSVISLLWQARTWRLSGPSIKLTFTPGYDSIWSFGQPTEAQRRHNDEQKPWRDHYFVEARNRGRAAATIESVRIGDKQSAILDLSKYIVASRSDALPPIRIEPATTLRWLFPLRTMIDAVREELELRTGNDDDYVRPNEFCAWVTVGDGQAISSRPFSDQGLFERLSMRASLIGDALRWRR